MSGGQDVHYQQPCLFVHAGGIFALSSLLFLLKKKTASFIILMAGLILYSLYLAGRGWITGILTPNNIFDAPFFAAGASVS